MEIQYPLYKMFSMGKLFGGLQVLGEEELGTVALARTARSLASACIWLLISARSAHLCARWRAAASLGHADVVVSSILPTASQKCFMNQLRSPQITYY